MTWLGMSRLVHSSATRKLSSHVLLRVLNSVFSGQLIVATTVRLLHARNCAQFSGSGFIPFGFTHLSSSGQENLALEVRENQITDEMSSIQLCTVNT